MKKLNLTRQDILLSLSFILIGVLTRTLFHLGENVEFVTALTLAAGYFLKNKKLSIIVVLIIMFATDLIIGNTSIYLFTWSGFLMTALIGLAFSVNKIKSKINTNAKLALFAEGTGILSTAIFFFWTNFGVVVLGNMYTHDLNGVIQSYINGLPFLANQLYANLVIVPLVFLAVNFVLNYRAKENKDFA